MTLDLSQLMVYYGIVVLVFIPGLFLGIWWLAGKPFSRRFLEWVFAGFIVYCVMLYYFGFFEALFNAVRPT